MRAAGTLLLIVLLGAMVVGFYLLVPYGPSSETFVDIAPGTGTARIAEQMERAGVIRSRYAMDLLRAVKDGSLKAGEYRFEGKAPVTEVYARLRRGDVYTRTLVVPEGYNIFDIAQAVEAAGLGTRADFLRAAHSQTELISTWSPRNGTEPTSVEGFLFPDTYHFSRHTTPEQMLIAMVRRFRQAAAQLGLSGDVRRTVTMASLVEKEVRQPAERPLVAGVFVNRMREGMPLQTDPSVIYAALLEGRYRGTIFASDLQSPSPYNTYKHTGLPPGPICNPGLPSLRAAMHPAQTDYLYFVSDAAGHSRFSTGLKEHSAQVGAYREAQRP